jgi:acetolactate decarboxylase
MTNLDTTIPTSLKTALGSEATRTKGTASSIVMAALSQYLGVPVHKLFQVSISGALVARVYDKEVSVKSIVQHGDFGLGTFADLDGEMVILEGYAEAFGASGLMIDKPDDIAPAMKKTFYTQGR